MKEQNKTNFSIGSEFGVSVGLGGIKQFSSFNLTGLKEDIPTMETDLGAIDNYIFPSDAGESIEIFLDAPADSTVIAVSGLDEDGIEKIEIVPVSGGGSGITAVPGLWSRINSTRNVGPALITGKAFTRASGAGNNFSVIGVLQKSVEGIFTVPKNKKGKVMALIPTMTKNTGGNDSLTARAKTRSPGGIFVTEFVIGLQRDGQTSPYLPNVLPERIGSFTDIKITVQAINAGIDTLFRMPIVLIGNDYLGEQS